jgi:hypothetical protein
MGETTETTMVTQTLAEWQAEAKRRFGDAANWRFVCPACGNEQTPLDFKELGVDPQLAYQECIGRHVDALDCDWTAYGLLGTTGKGRLVQLTDRQVEVFDFAEAERDG